MLGGNDLVGQAAGGARRRTERVAVERRPLSGSTGHLRRIVEGEGEGAAGLGCNAVGQLQLVRQGRAGQRMLGVKGPWGAAGVVVQVLRGEDLRGVAGHMSLAPGAE